MHFAAFLTCPEQRELEGKETDKVQEADVAKPAVPEWQSPLVLCSKKEESLNFCLDHHRRNVVAVRDSYLIPSMEKYIDALGEV